MEQERPACVGLFNQSSICLQETPLQGDAIQIAEASFWLIVCYVAKVALCSGSKGSGCRGDAAGKGCCLCLDLQ